MNSKIAIEIGTSYTKIFKSRADVVLYEPTIIAVSKNNYKKPVAVGIEAFKLQGKVGDGVKIIRPVNNTEIVDVKALVSLLSAFISKIKVKGERFSSVLLTVQCGSDRQIMSRFENALNKIGLYNVVFAETPVLALLGANAPLTDTSCHAVIDIGGGQTTVCVLNLNGVISGVSAEIGGNKLNEMLQKHVEETMNLHLSMSEIENLKRSIASIVDDDNTKTIVQGKQTLTGKPHTQNITASSIVEPIKEYAKKTAKIANLVFDNLSTDCLKELSKNGVYLTGGGSLLYGLEDYFTKELGFVTTLVDEPELSSIIGAGKLINDKDLLNKIKLKG